MSHANCDQLLLFSKDHLANELNSTNIQPTPKPLENIPQLWLNGKSCLDFFKIKLGRVQILSDLDGVMLDFANVFDKYHDDWKNV